MAKGGRSGGGRSGGRSGPSSRSIGTRGHSSFHTSHGVGSRGHSSFHSSYGIGSRGHIGSHHGHHHRHHHHHHYRGGGRSMPNPGKSFQTLMDAVSAKTGGPTMANGVLTIQGGQISVINHLNTLVNTQNVINYQPQPQYYQNPLQILQQPVNIQMANFGVDNPMNILMSDSMGQMSGQQQMITPQMAPQSNVVTQAHITVVGNKTVASNQCCFLITMICGAFLIFPLLLMCCDWWKRMVYPKYDLDPQFYRALGRFLRKEYQCRVLVLTVVDNGLDAQKARLLGQSLSGTSLTGFTFVNTALDCNYLANEADLFPVNMVPIKALPFTTSLIWGDMIL